MRQRRRFYRRATAVITATGVQVELDGRPVRTPAGRLLILPTVALADAVAGEWDAQEETIRPETMPLTALAATALDRVGPQRVAVIEGLLRYAATDVLCYWADHPPELVDRQRRAWTPLLEWARTACGADLRVTTGVMPVAQPAAAMAALRTAVAALDDLALAALGHAAPLCGSLVIGLALVDGRVDADGAFSLALLDERYQAQHWGEDQEAQRRRQALKSELEAAARFLILRGASGGRGDGGPSERCGRDGGH